MPFLHRRTLVALLVASGASLTAATPARADDIGDTLIKGTLFLCAIVDVPFTIYDIVIDAKRQVPSTGWAAAQIAAMVPQVLITQTFLAITDIQGKEDEPAAALALVPAFGSTTLLTWASWGVNNPRVPPGLLAGGSPLVAADLTFSGLAIAHGVSGQFSSRPIGVAQMAITLPQIIAGATVLRRNDPAMLPTVRNTWITLTTWSSVLFAHGVASTILGGHRPKSTSDTTTSTTTDTQPEPEPEGEPAPRPRLGPQGDPKKPPLLVPAMIQVAPTMVTDGVARAPGLAVVGVF